MKKLGGDLAVADMDMDKHFSITHSPPFEDVLGWMLEQTPGQEVLAVSAHREMLLDMTAAKRRGELPDQFARLLFVYLRTPDPVKHHERLMLPNAHGQARPDWHVEGVLAGQEAMHAACKDLADVTLNTASMTEEEVVRVIHALKSALVGRG